MKRCLILLAVSTAVVFAETPNPAFQFDWKGFSGQAGPRQLRLLPPQFLLGTSGTRKLEP